MHGDNLKIDESIVGKFEVAWLEGKPLPIEDCLVDKDDPRYLGTLTELVLIELEFASGVDQSVDVSAETIAQPQLVEQYLERFPRLNTPEIVKRLVQQEFYVRQKYGAAPRVDEYEKRFPKIVHGSEDLPIKSEFGATVARDVESGTTIDKYKLLQKIGEGGFGEVYMAEQVEPVRRRVALKVIKPGMDSRSVVARFESERQALAMMDHENVARVFDGGTTESGRPYFVMELVKGIPITQYCDNNKLMLRQRLELFLPVCRALQHAHQKGIIHRDVKPSNVLIALYDGEPVPKVIDFGVAKAIEQPLTEKTMFTQYGQVIGTPLYMSPEQAEMNQLDIDTRSDVYSLGVLLYELLTGTTPLQAEQLRSAAFVEMLRIIREVEPPTPSNRLSTSGEAIAAISAHRKTDPGKLGKVVRGELDWIVMKALEKDRTRRYESASAFAADIQRHLENEPVDAGPPSATYRLRKFATKHRVALTTVSAFVFVLLAGIIASTWLAIDAHEQRKIANKERQGAESARDETQSQLATNYWQSGVVQRDVFENRLKAAHYFMKAAEEFDKSPQRSRNAQLAAESLTRHVKLEAILDCESSVVGVVFSADETRVLTWSVDGTVRIFDTKSGEQLVKSTHDGAVIGAVFSRKDERILSWAYDHSARIWDAQSGDQIVELKHDSILGAAFSHNEKRVVTWGGFSGEPSKIRVWDSQTGKILTQGSHTDSVVGAAFNRTDAKILSWSFDNTARLWDAESGESEAAFKHGAPKGQGQMFPAHVYGAVFSHDESQVLTWSDIGIHLWNARSQELVFESEMAFSKGASFSRDESRILGWGSGGTRLWDAKNGNLVFEFKHDGFVDGVVVSDDERQILTWGTRGYATYDVAKGSCRLWNVETGESLESEHDSRVHDATFRRKDDRVISWSQHGETGRVSIQVRDGNGRVQFVELKHNEKVHGVTVTQDGEGIMSWSEDGSVRLWSMNLEKQPPLATSYRSVSASDDKRRILTLDENAIARGWNANTCEQQFEVQLAKNVEGSLLCRKKAAILIWNDDITELWDTRTGKMIVQFPSVSPFRGSQLSHNDERLLTWGGGWLPGDPSFFQIWDTNTGESLAKIKHDIAIIGATFNQDSSRVLTWNGNGTVILWNAATTKQILRLEHGDEVRDVQFRDGESQILSLSGSAIKLWDLTGKLLVQFRHKAPKNPNAPELYPSPDVGGYVFDLDGDDLLTWAGISGVASLDSTSMVVDPMGALSKHRFSGGELRLWDAKTGELHYQRRRKDAIGGAAFSRDSTRALSWGGSWDAGSISVWELSTGKLLFQTDFENSVTGAAYNEDQSRILCWTRDGIVRLLDSTTGDIVTTFKHGSDVAFARFHDDETQVLIVNRSAPPRFWNVDVDKEWPREWLELRLESRTGTRLDEIGDVKALSCDEWQKRKRRIEMIRDKSNAGSMNLSLHQE